MNPTQRPEWQALSAHQQQIAPISIGELFQQEAQRTQQWQFDACGLMLDLSRHRATATTWQLLLSLARASQVEQWRDRLLAGEAINNTEQRPAWHSALRAAPTASAAASRVAEQQHRFLQLADQLRAGEIKGGSGRRIERVICCGIGGSDLGPRLVTEALMTPQHQAAIDLRFVTNIDPVELDAALVGAVPGTTLVVAISKSFTTLETLENLKAVRHWFKSQAPSLPLASHFVAITSQPERAIAFEFAKENILTFADWVGGRYSVWSPCGFPVALAHGSAVFQQLLEGAAQMDHHFAQAPLERNAPVLLALLGCWYINFWQERARAVMPYAQRLRQLPAYLQQLEMESLGKRVNRDGQAINFDTSAILWGEAGTTAQHSVFQFLHQGSHTCPVDFVTCASFEQSSERRERLLYANALAQADALAFGDAVLTSSAAASGNEYARCPGNRASSFITLPDLSARSVGALLALYEHRTFVQSVIWNINAFDQWGVEIGKKLLAQRLAATA